MGSASSFRCCCWPFLPRNRSADQARWRAERGPDRRAAARGYARGAQRALPRERRCDVCGVIVDPVLFDGHREVCRQNSAKILRERQQQPEESQGFEDDLSKDCEPDELCVVCFAARRSYAFIPCGHVSCCERCVRALECCPLCREPRTALCRVATSVFLQFKCRHCGEIIAPELHEGHREVCGFRMMLARQNQVEEEVSESGDGAAASTGGCDVAAACDISAENCITDATAATSSVCVTKPPMQYCVECHGVERPLVIMLPCGHRLLCEVCCSGRKTCPVCLQCIESSVKTFC